MLVFNSDLYGFINFFQIVSSFRVGNNAFYYKTGSPEIHFVIIPSVCPSGSVVGSTAPVVGTPPGPLTGNPSLAATYDAEEFDVQSNPLNHRFVMNVGVAGDNFVLVTAAISGTGHTRVSNFIFSFVKLLDCPAYTV